MNYVSRASLKIILLMSIVFLYSCNNNQNLILNKNGLLISKTTQKAFSGDFRRDLNAFNGGYYNCCDSIIGTSLNGIFDAIIYNYYPSGEIESEFSVDNKNISKSQIENDYVNLRKVGLHKTFYKNGQIKSERNYNYQNGKIDGYSYEYFENGQKKSERVYENGILNGNVYKWFKNGNYKSSELYREGRKSFVQYGFESGVLKSEVWYETKRDEVQISPTIREADVFYENGVRKFRYRNYKSPNYMCWNNLGIKIDCSSLRLRMEFD